MARKATARAAAPAAPARQSIRMGDSGAVNIGDSLVNLVSGLGTSKDKTAATNFVFTEIDKLTAETAYRGDWISRKIIDIPAFDATREWRSWEAESKDISDIEDAEANLGLQQKVMTTLRRARLYGGAAMVLGVDQGKTDQPLELDKLGKDCLKFVHVVSRYDLSAGEIEWDITSPYYARPKYYQRATPGSGVVTLHPSRVVQFIGLDVPDPTYTQGWGDSVLGVVRDAVIQLGTVSAAMAQLVQESKVDVVSIPELSERIRNKDYEERLKTRFGLANTMKSIFSLLLIDKEETWTRLQANFAGMPEVMQAFMLMVCGAADIPATRFMGQSPAGLSATGESDTRNYYDRISTEQKVVMQPSMKPLDDVLQCHVFGKVVDGMFYNWNPLWQLSEAEKAAVAVQKSTVMTADVNAALMDPMVLQKARENQLIEDGTYPGLEQIIEEYGTDITEREQTMTPEEAMLAMQQQGSDPNGGPNGLTPATNNKDPHAPGPAEQNIDPNASRSQRPVSDGKKRSMQSGKFARGAALGNSYEDYVMHARASNRRAMSRRAWEAQTQARDSDEITKMLRRIKDATTPRPLYVYRPVLNWKDIAKFYKDNGLETTVGAEMHATVIYSKNPVDWIKVGEDNFGSDASGNLTVKAGGPRVMEKFNDALVLAFASSDLSYRHQSAEYRAECSWDYEDYTPHVTISYNAGAVDIRNLPAWTGPIEFGPEVFEEITSSFDPAELEEA